ncbi:hypothetical protein JI749_12975 [Devosia oryziradicis]|uniref:Glyoxalase-related protein domain-containing protein n=1 Tax=Devosia oryziradicis TaxID=2801335 RepID=A0ABX7BTM5_9HYPH|nr:hypothetical protein JI749_12975 [Devosia oryziradicis]
MAKLLRQGLAEREIELSHGECLELVARQFGFANWNILSARIDAGAGMSDGETPSGWIRAGKSPKFYRVGVDGGLNAAWIESKPELIDTIRGDDFCTLMQSVDARPYLGRRMRVSSQLRATQVDGGVTIWFRVDGPSGSLRFENLERYDRNGPIAGNTDWTERDIVLDVPPEATTLNYGFYLKGNGRGWARGFNLEAVDATVLPNTPDGGVLKHPTNLTFVELR